MPPRTEGGATPKWGFRPTPASAATEEEEDKADNPSPTAGPAIRTGVLDWMASSLAQPAPALLPCPSPPAMASRLFVLFVVARRRIYYICALSRTEPSIVIHLRERQNKNRPVPHGQCPATERRRREKEIRPVPRGQITDSPLLEDTARPRGCKAQGSSLAARLRS